MNSNAQQGLIAVDASAQAGPVNLLGLSREKLRAWLKAIGEKPFRADRSCSGYITTASMISPR